MSLVFEYIHELRIAWRKFRLLHSAPNDRRRHAEEFVRLIRMRSPRRIQRMERERGLL